MSPLWKMSAVVVLGMVLSSCGPQEFSIALLNTGEKEIHDAYVLFDGFQSRGGILIPHKKAVHLGIKKEIPEKALVHWKDLNGEAHESEVEVASNVRPLPEGTPRIFFEIDSNGKVTVRAESEPRY